MVGDQVGETDVGLSVIGVAFGSSSDCQFSSSLLVVGDQVGEADVRLTVVGVAFGELVG